MQAGKPDCRPNLWHSKEKPRVNPPLSQQSPAQLWPSGISPAPYSPPLRHNCQRPPGPAAHAPWPVRQMPAKGWPGPCPQDQHFPEIMVRVEGLEPPRLAAPEPKSGASANFATPACKAVLPPCRALIAKPAPAGESKNAPSKGMAIQPHGTKNAPFVTNNTSRLPLCCHSLGQKRPRQTK